MAWPIVTKTSGGLPVTVAANGLGTPYEEAANGFGTAVTFVASGGIPVVLGGVSTFPRRGSDGSLPTLDIDFVRGLYWANGAFRSASYFTTAAGTPTIEVDGLKADSGDRLVLPDQAWFNLSAGTCIVEWKDQGVANDAARIAFSVGAGSGGTQERFEIGDTYNGSITTRVLQLYMGNISGATILSASGGLIHNGYYKAALNWTAGAATTYVDNGTLVSAATFSGSWATPMDKNGLAFRANFTDQYLSAVGTERLRRVTVYATRQSDAFGVAQTLVTTKSNLHFLGDSFVAAGTLLRYATNTAIQDAYRVLSFDGVASSTLAEQADRFDLTPTYWDRQVVIVNGSADSSTALQLTTAYDRIAAHTARPPLYVQPNPGTLIAGSANRITWDAVEADVLAHVGATYYCNTLTDMLANGDGGGTDNADIANQIWPTSCVNEPTDHIHPNAKGAGVMAATINTKILANGW